MKQVKRKVFGIGLAAVLLAGFGSTWSVAPAEAAGWGTAPAPYQHTGCHYRESSNPFAHYCP